MLEPVFPVCVPLDGNKQCCFGIPKLKLKVLLVRPLTFGKLKLKLKLKLKQLHEVTKTKSLALVLLKLKLKLKVLKLIDLMMLL